MDTMMRSGSVDGIRRRLLDRQRALLDAVDGIEADLQLIAQSREAEVEAQARDEAMARLLDRVGERDRHELEEIYRALAKIPAGVYGLCERCGEPIAVERLQATPDARYCVDCQAAIEAAPPPVSRPFEPRAHRPIPDELRDLDDAELAEAVRERIRAYGEPDLAGIDVRCHGGVARLSGEVASDGQRQVLVQLVADGMGLDVIDRLQVVGVEREGGAPSSIEADVPGEEAPDADRIPVRRGMQPLAAERWGVPEDEGEPPETVPDAPIAEKE
jgi:DnaK suppressor protein